MYRGWWGAIVAAVTGVVLMGCPPPGKCGGQTCNDTQRCDVSSLTCVEDLPPQLVIDPISEVVSSPTFVVKGKLTDDEGLRDAQWRVGGREWASLALQSDGAFSITVDAPEVDAEKLVVSVRGTDAKGREAADSIEVTIDRVAPVLTLVSPDAGVTLAQPTFQIALTATDGSGALGSLSVDGVPVTAPASGSVMTASVAVPATANSTPVVVTVVATDARGNSRTEEFSFVGDRVGPTVTIESPDAGAVLSTANISIDALVVEPGSVRSVVFRIGSTDVEGTPGMNGHWTASLPTEAVERDEIITVTATDAAGNAGTATRTMRVDRVAPQLSVQTPSPNGVFRAAIALSVQTSDAASVTASLEGAMVTLTGGPTLWTGSMPVGSHDYAAASLTVVAADAAGNEATVMVPVAVDTVAPIIIISSPTPGQMFKATDFATGANVTTSWTVNDADPQAGTTLVNGASASGTTFARPTNTTDNPANYSNTITAADRAGNTSTATISYSVDRVPPRAINWAPQPGVRNHWPRHTEIIFSERMIGGAGILVSAGGPYAGSWNAGGDNFQITDDALAGKAVDFFVNPALTDLHGNPLSPDPGHKRVHFATWFAPGSVRTLATSVESFSVATDGDGVATVGYRTLGTTGVNGRKSDVVILTDTGGAFSTARAWSGGSSLTGTEYGAPTVNSWNVVDNTTLESSPRWGASFSSWEWLGDNQYQFVTSLDGGISISAGTAVSVPVSRPALTYEPGTFYYGAISGSQYQRAPAPSYTLSAFDYRDVVQSNTNWTALASTSAQVIASRFYCRLGTIFSGPGCATALYSANTTSPTRLQGATTRSGSCFALTWDNGSTRYGFFLPKPACEGGPILCTDTVLSAAALPLADLRVGTWDNGTEDTLLFSYRSGSDIVLAKMTAGACSTSSTIITTWSLPGAKAHAPVRVGYQAALLYIDASDVLKLQLAP